MPAELFWRRQIWCLRCNSILLESQPPPRTDCWDTRKTCQPLPCCLSNKSPMLHSLKTCRSLSIAFMLSLKPSMSLLLCHGPSVSSKERFKKCLSYRREYGVECSTLFHKGWRMKSGQRELIVLHYMKHEASSHILIYESALFLFSAVNPLTQHWGKLFPQWSDLRTVITCHMKWLTWLILQVTCIQSKCTTYDRIVKSQISDLCRNRDARYLQW